MKSIKYILFCLIINFTGIGIVYAAPSASIAVSNNSIVNGNSVTATVTLKETMAWDIKITSSGNTSGCTKSFVDVVDSDRTTKLSVTCKSNGIGSITFKMSGAISNSKREKVNISGSKTVKVVKPREKSNNNNLKSLSVEGYSISPSFNKNTLEYTVNLESNIEKIKINATKEDGYANVSGTGEKEVQEGENKFEITVTSETGKSKVYTVNAIVKDSNPIVKKIDGKNYTIIKRVSALTKPEDFEQTSVIMNEIEIPAFYNEKTKIMLVGLKDEEGNIYLYKYEDNTDNYTKYEVLTSKQMTVIFKEPNVEVDGYTKTKIIINDQEYNVYKNTENKNYVLIYGTLLETGESNWYLYNIEENSIQTYMGDFIDNIKTTFEKEKEEYKIVLLGLAGLSILLLLVIIIQMISRSKLRKKYIKKIQSLTEKQEELKKELEEKEAKTDKQKTEAKPKNKKSNKK